MTIKQLIISCNSSAEAAKIGQALLKQRLVGCVDVLPKTSSMYFWPPKKGKIAKGKGVMLLAMTLPRHIGKAKILITKKHSDKVPFIGSVDVHDVSQEYYRWLATELRDHA
jgi:periplasmic divalent cation tolerance protein